MTASPAFLAITCQVGAERAVKLEISALWPDWRFAFSRPGFLTFKLPQPWALGIEAQLGSVFARAYSWGLGQVKAGSRDALLAAFWEAVPASQFADLHVWGRDQHRPGFHDYEPGPTEQTERLARELRAAAPPGRLPTGTPAPIPAPGAPILDCILVAEDHWWIGQHLSSSPEATWPGGLRPTTLPPHAVSRAYLKLADALDWSQLPIRAGERAAELGCSPGGAAQALLDRGLSVLGIDPAPVHRDVLAHKHFTHLQMRAADVPRRQFRGIRWLVSDMNVAPQFTLDAVEAIVTHAEVDVRGLLLTLKLPTWDLASEVPAWLDRIRGWGYAQLSARQLQHNRQEFCVAAYRTRTRETRPKVASTRRRPRPPLPPDVSVRRPSRRPLKSTARPPRKPRPSA